MSGNKKPRKKQMPPKVAEQARGSFFFYLALAMLISVVAGFGGRALALPALTPPITITIIVHAIIMLTWYSLMVVQAGLIGKKNIALHMRLGKFSPALVAAILISGTLVTLETYTRRIGVGASGAELAVYLSFSSLLGFIILYVLAYRMRALADYHKRYILLAGIAMMLAATFRLAAAIGAPQVINMGIVIQYSFVTAIMFYDMRTLKRIHMATITGTLVCLTMTLGIFTTGMAPAWASFVKGILAP